MCKKTLLAVVTFVLVEIFLFTNYVYAQKISLRPFTVIYETEETWYRPFPIIDEAQKGWFRPFVVLGETYDDNVFLDQDNEKEDWITTISPGFVIKPQTKHEFKLDYRADLNYFDKYSGQNHDDHTTTAKLGLNFDELSLEIANMFHYFSDRSGSEDINRIPRTQDYAQAITTFDFNKLDLSLGYYYRYEKYRSDDAIGDFQGQALTYKDLARDEHKGEIELGLKLWPKTSLLFSGNYGTIEHDTGKKSNSDYFDALTGLRGQLTAKCQVEGKVGYRDQNYKDFDDDFDGVIFNGSLIENFTSRDVLRLDFLKRTYDTIYKDNAYYKNTFIGSGFKHGFTERLWGHINFYYQWNRYPIETIEAGQTIKRKDDLWAGSIGLSYQLPKGFTLSLLCEHRIRDSNVSRFDYKNNRATIALTGSF